MSGRRIDPITLEVLRHALTAVGEEMNANLIRSAYSPNIKERRDCSCAVFDAAGEMVTQAETIPVHLGAMPASVAAAMAYDGELAPGDIVVLNDPYRGGAHLPDITFVAPVHRAGELVGYVANRAHHADVGGKEPGSLAGDSREIYQEGLRLPPVRLWKGGRVDADLRDLILLNVRTPEERWGDLRAQFASCQAGVRRFLELVDRHGFGTLRDGMQEIQDYAERRMRAEIGALSDGRFVFEDALEGDGFDEQEVPIRAEVIIDGERLTVDFAGTAAQVIGPVNAVLAVTQSAVYYAVRTMTDPTIPPSAGCYRAIHVLAPKGSVVAAVPPAPVVGGNLETSQRIVDVVLGCLGQAIPGKRVAASQGSMNNVAIGGIDPRSGRPYTIYETIAGGCGASASGDGADGVHSHMTNTLNTPVEALETAYPLRIVRYELAAGTGGGGRFRGGLGLRREIQVVGHAARVSLLTERRNRSPYGVAGGEPGHMGANRLIRAAGHVSPLPSKASFEICDGETLSIQTPGGGGYGSVDDRPAEAIERDRREDRSRT